MSRSAHPYLAFIAWLCVGFVVLEAGWRYYLLDRVTLPGLGQGVFVPHETRAFTYRPNVEGNFLQADAFVPYRINQAGFRGPEIDEPKRRFRILVVGDSEVAGVAVAQSDMFTRLLEQQLGSDHFEVINGGVAAYNAVQTMLNARERSREIKPDLIVFALTVVNDIQGTGRGLRALFKRTHKRPVGYIGQEGQLKIDHTAAQRYYQANRDQAKKASSIPLKVNSTIYNTIKGAVKRYTRRGLRDPNVLLGRPFLAEFSPEYSTYGLSADAYERLWAEGWDVVKKVFLQSRQDAEAVGARFALMAIPGKIQVLKSHQQAYLSEYPNLKLDLNRINRELAGFARANNIHQIDLLTPMLAERDAGEDELFHELDQHLDKAGHHVMARVLAHELRASGLLRR